MNVSSLMILLLDIGKGITSNVDPTDATSGINKFLINCGTAVGAILIAVATLKMIIALAEESVAERQKASLLFGVGIVFVSVEAVVKTLLGPKGSITEATGYITVAQNVLSVIGSMASWAGAIMIIFAVYSFILAIAQESVESQTKATNASLVGIGFVSLHFVCDALKNKISSKEPTSFVTVITGWLGSIASYGGAILLVMAIFRMIISIRTEDLKERNDAIKLMMVSIALISFKSVIKAFGIG